MAIKCMKNTFDSIDQVNNLREIQVRCRHLLVLLALCVRFLIVFTWLRGSATAGGSPEHHQAA